ncbi:MAG: DUF3793 family protein [Clostridia bacterium]|nr:DUF3793 family protein [Clostridia bacterium]
METAPVREKLKPASLMCFTKKGRNLYEAWCRYQECIPAWLGLKTYILKDTGRSSLVLLYDTVQLKGALSHYKVNNFLHSFGYSRCDGLQDYLSVLKQRFRSDFPHEVGAFLGIPVEDVESFIRLKGKQYLFCGYWKVYHEPGRAKKLFEGFDQAKAKAVQSFLIH